MNHWSISQKIYIPLFIGLLIGLFLIVFSSFLSVQDIEKSVYEKEKETLKVYVNNQLDGKYDIAITNAINIASNFYVIDSLVNNDRKYQYQ